MGLVEHLLFNLSLLLVLLLFAQIDIERKGKQPFSKKRTLGYFLIGTILCILFTKEICSHLTVDLRAIPLILGGLYFGLALPVAATIILLTAFSGIDINFWSTFFIYLVLATLIHNIHPHFLKFPSKRRMIVSTLIAQAPPLVIMSIYFFTRMDTQSLDVWIGMLCIPTLGTVLISYAFESINKNLIIREQVTKTQKLDAVTHMGAAFSHEIRNPITTVKGFLQLINEEIYAHDKAKEYVKISIEELKKAENVISDYLTFAKPSLDQVEEIDVHREMNHVLKVLEPFSNMNTVVIERDYAPIGIIQGDKAKFHQCFINIIKNAFESMSSGGRLIIKTIFTNEHLHITITDNGSGMSDKVLSRLGEPFYSTKEGKGTGLGLMVSYSIIRAMRGAVHVTSEQDIGTSFEIIFPQYIVNANHKEITIPSFDTLLDKYR